MGFLVINFLNRQHRRSLFLKLKALVPVATVVEI